eukprot:m.636931 g.636931  ORF g.636931 m.636931 type:complete len:106 (-) comp58315_c0_seq2:980-1297(-)
MKGNNFSIPSFHARLSSFILSSSRTRSSFAFCNENETQTVSTDLSISGVASAVFAGLHLPQLPTFALSFQSGFIESPLNLLTVIAKTGKLESGMLVQRPHAENAI